MGETVRVRVPDGTKDQLDFICKTENFFSISDLVRELIRQKIKVKDGESLL